METARVSLKTMGTLKTISDHDTEGTRASIALGHSCNKYKALMVNDSFTSLCGNYMPFLVDFLTERAQHRSRNRFAIC